MSDVRVVQQEGDDPLDSTVTVREAGVQPGVTVATSAGQVFSPTASVAATPVTTVVVPNPRLRRFRQTRRIIYTVVNIIVIFIIIRIVLAAFGANPESPFAAFIYGLTTIFIAPFLGLFGESLPPQYGAPVFEASSLVAIAIYYLFAWIGLKIAEIRLMRPTPAPDVIETQPRV